MRHAVFSGKATFGGPIGNSKSDCFYLLFGKLRAWVIFAPRTVAFVLATFAQHVLHIIALRSCAEMGGIAAYWVIAGM